VSDVPGPLELPGWIEFNERRTGLTAERLSPESESSGAAARAVLYRDRRGRVKLPRNNPYLPVAFSSARSRPSGRTAEWLRAAAPLVEAMERHGTANTIWLPPVVDDVRPWRWAGFVARIGYTYWLDLPYETAAMDRGARRTTDKAGSLGLTVRRVDDVRPVMECLLETEARKRFSHHLGERELRMLQDLVGPESLRMYVCFDARGRAAAARIALLAPSATALAWVAGTRSEQRSSGANHLLFRHLLEDLSAAGATGLDLCGANIPSVAQFKSEWGGRLVPVYGVRTHSLRAGARFLADWLHARRAMPGAHPRR
jgi:hypothetical protein